jgi:hypothetical protein
MMFVGQSDDERWAKPTTAMAGQWQPTLSSLWVLLRWSMASRRSLESVDGGSWLRWFSSSSNGEREVSERT